MATKHRPILRERISQVRSRRRSSPKEASNVVVWDLSAPKGHCLVDSYLLFGTRKRCWGLSIVLKAAVKLVPFISATSLLSVTVPSKWVPLIFVPSKWGQHRYACRRDRISFRRIMEHVLGSDTMTLFSGSQVFPLY